MNGKVIVGVIMAFIFIMSGFAFAADNSGGNTSISAGNMNAGVAKPEHNNSNINTPGVNINIVGMNSFIANLFSSGRIDKTFIYNGIVIHEESNKIKNNEVKAHFFVHTKNFSKKTAITIISKNNTYYIFNDKIKGSVKINSNTDKIVYDPGGTYYYYVSSSGSSSHSWTTPVSSGHWKACSKTIVGTDTAFITWNGPSFIFVYGIPELYAPELGGAYWKESNNDGWSAECGRLPMHVTGPEMPVSGKRTLDNYYGANTAVEVTVEWTYTPVLGGF